MSSIRTKVWGLVDTTTNKLLDIALYYNAVADLSGNFDQPTRIIRLESTGREVDFTVSDTGDVTNAD